jgi:hypothetical protein
MRRDVLVKEVDAARVVVVIRASSTRLSIESGCEDAVAANLDTGGDGE